MVANFREAGRPASPVEWIDKTITLAATTISIVALVTMFLALCAEVIVRYVTKTSLGWPAELPNFMFPWLVMSGIVLAAQHGAHISVTILLGKIQRGAQRSLLLGMQIVIAFTFFYLTWVGLEVLEITGSEVYPVTGVSARWAYLALIAGFAGVGVTALTTFVRLMASEDPLSVRAHQAEDEL
jgi:TRAP-type transport system small permease protein